MGEIVERLPAADKETLQLVAPVISQEVGLEERLDAFGRAPYTE